MRAYATLLMGLTDNQTTTRVSLALAHNVAIFNRTRCFQNRLRELKPGFPLVVLHNFDVDLSRVFDRLHRIGDRKQELSSADRRDSLSVHHNKIHIWSLEEYERVVYIDSDIYLRVVPDELFSVRLDESTPMAAVACMAYTTETTGLKVGAKYAHYNDSGARHFNSGVMVLTPNMTVVAQLLQVIRFQQWRHYTNKSSSAPYSKACTGNARGDQYYLNGYFQAGWAHLEWRWNTQMRYPNPGRPLMVHPGINTHFVGTHKPPWNRCVHHTYTSQDLLSVNESRARARNTT